MGLRVCIEAGCWQPADGPRCPEHERAHQRERNALAKRKAYVSGWPCACCGTLKDITRHHVIPLADSDPRSLTSILVPMCRSCNSSIGAKTMTDHRGPLHGGTERA